MTDARSSEIARLLDWGRAGGASWDGIEFGVDAAGNASVRASRALAAGEAILSSPRSLMIVDNELGLDVELEDALAVWLARRDPASHWRPYVDALPRELSELPMFHGEEDLAMLEGTAAHASALDKLRDVTRAHARLRDAVPLADFMWGRAIVQSRAFHAPGTLEHRIALLPVVDIMNHRPGDTTWTYDGRIVVTTERAFEAGEEVCFSYGDQRSNSYLFVHYGFTLPDNPANEAQLEIGSTSVRVACTFDRRFRGALAIARAQVSGADGDEWLGADIEAAAFDVISAAARHALAELDAHAAPTGARPWERACAIVRAGERAVLEEILGVATEVRPLLHRPRDVPADAPPLLRQYLEALD